MSSEGKESILFFLLSGEHPTLPHAELKAVLKAFGVRYEVIGELAQLSRLKCEPGHSAELIYRTAFTKACCLELAVSRAEEEEILSAASDVPFWEFVRPGQSFRIRVRRVRGASPDISVMDLEAKLGSVIFKAVRDLKVDLVRPDVEFLGVLTEGMFFLGLKLSEVVRPGFTDRRPSKRPFFHPTAMMPKLARCMVNLARSRPGELVLDPFCGTGSILIEAGLLGCRILGSDINAKMAFGCLLNLRFFGLEPEGVLTADALRPPFTRADRVVTDPPYGRSSSTAGLEVREIYEGLLALLPELVEEGKMACIAAPSQLGMADMASEAGLELVEAHYYFVHSGLTRELAVLQVP